jgi:hypothetical protein
MRRVTGYFRPKIATAMRAGFRGTCGAGSPKCDAVVRHSPRSAHDLGPLSNRSVSQQIVFDGGLMQMKLFVNRRSQLQQFQ